MHDIQIYYPIILYYNFYMYGTYGVLYVHKTCEQNFVGKDFDSCQGPAVVLGAKS